MKYKVVFSGMSCMAYLGIIIQKLFYRSKKRYRTNQHMNASVDRLDDTKSHDSAEINLEDDMEEDFDVKTLGSNGDEILHTNKDPNSLSSVASTTDSNRGAGTNLPGKSQPPGKSATHTDENINSTNKLDDLSINTPV